MGRDDGGRSYAARAVGKGRMNRQSCGGGGGSASAREEAGSKRKSMSSARCEARSEGSKGGATNGAHQIHEQRRTVAANRA